MSANKAFKNSYNNLGSSCNYTNKKKAETIFISARNHIEDKKSGQFYLNNVNKTKSGFLSSVGGYNVNSYDILTNVAKGQSYIATPSVTIGSKTASMDQNDCSLNIISNPPNSSCDIFEGPYLQNSIDLSSCQCLSTQTKQFTNYDPSNIIQDPKYSYKKLVNTNLLENFNLHRALQIDCSNN